MCFRINLQYIQSSWFWKGILQYQNKIPGIVPPFWMVLVEELGMRLYSELHLHRLLQTLSVKQTLLKPSPLLFPFRRVHTLRWMLQKVYLLVKTPAQVWHVHSFYHVSSICSACRDMQLKKCSCDQGCLDQALEETNIVAWKQVGVAARLPAESGFGSNSRLGVKLSQSNSFFPVCPLMNGTNWLKTLVGGDERAGCYSVREWTQTATGSGPDWCGGPQRRALTIVHRGEDIIRGTVNTVEQTHKGTDSTGPLKPLSCWERKHFVECNDSCRLSCGMHLWLIYYNDNTCLVYIVGKHWLQITLAFKKCIYFFLVLDWLNATE